MNSSLALAADLLAADPHCRIDTDAPASAPSLHAAPPAGAAASALTITSRAPQGGPCACAEAPAPNLASAHPTAANEEIAQVDEIAVCRSFLRDKQFALEVRGFEPVLREFPAHPGCAARMTLSWTPAVVPAFSQRVSRQYTLEIVFAAGERPRAYFAGCGIDCASTVRCAGADLLGSLQAWYQDFTVLSRQQHQAIFGETLAGEAA